MTTCRVGVLVKSPNHLAIAEGKDIKGVWVEPTPSLILSHVKKWADKANVTPVRIPGYWYDKPGGDMAPGLAPAPGEKVVYALHGGAFTLWSAYPGDLPANIARSLLEHIPSLRRLFAVEYRLSVGPPNAPAHPFPAALVDVIAGYDYLVNVVGFDPADIVVEGDSAGGNLALALTRYLIENQEELRVAADRMGTKPLSPPSALILNSPWADLGTSHDKPAQGYLRRSDFFSPFFLDRTMTTKVKRLDDSVWAYTGVHGYGFADINQYISPGSKHVAAGSYKGWPRTFMTAGGAEWLLDGIHTLKERMSADMGEGTGPGQLWYHEAPDEVHCYLSNDWCEPARTETFKAITEWL